MTSKLTRERLQEIAEDGFLKHGESKELARMALAEKASDPFIQSAAIDEINNQFASQFFEIRYYRRWLRVAIEREELCIFPGILFEE